MPPLKNTGSLRLAALVILGTLFPVSPAVPAELPLDPQETLLQLDQVSVDPSQIYRLRDVQIPRDRARIYFNRGFVGFLTRVAGEVTGAVFSGDGEVLLVPPNAVEKRNLALFTQSPILTEQFTTVYMRFTDKTAEELLAQAEKLDREDMDQPTGFVEDWNPVVRRLNPDYSGRVLQDLMGDRSLPFFHAEIRGVNLGVFEINQDERLAEAVAVGAARRSHGRLFGDVWCSFPSRTSEARAAELLVGPVRVVWYKIDTRINPDHSLDGRAELLIESKSSADRVLIFELSRHLKVTDVKDAGGGRLVVFQNPSLEESEVAARGNDWIVVVLPAPYPRGEKFRLDFTYQGQVIADVGNGVLYVGARGSWYPNRGRSERSAYDLTFHYPEPLTLVATGSRVEEKTEQGWKISRWVSDGPMPVAGFNLGAYQTHVRQVGSSTVEVYAARTVESSREKRHAAAIPPTGLVFDEFGRRKEMVELLRSRTPPPAPAALLESVAENAANALRYFETLFGPFPYPRLAISQIPESFGQGWPELVYLPTLSFLKGSELEEMGFGGRFKDVRDKTIVAHEVAHQWWGNLIGWKTYRDQWLSEGVATYAAALELTQHKAGERNLRELLRGYKQDLLAKTEEGKTVESGGPIWLGLRLSNSLNPMGYSSLAYKKGCWVLHMLRGILTDPASGSDERFFRMLREFVATYRGGSPSTEDFVRHAEKYMTRASDLEHNRRLDWFFNEWVYGTGVPTYKLNATTQQISPKKFIVRGAIEQEGVTSNFQMLVPIVAIFGRDRKVILGRVGVTDAGGRFRFTTGARPTRVAVDEDNLLAVVR